MIYVLESWRILHFYNLLVPAGQCKKKDEFVKKNKKQKKTFTEGTYSQHRCFHQTVLSLVHIICLIQYSTNESPVLLKTPEVWEENTGDGFKTRE